jgi:Fic family protein
MPSTSARTLSEADSPDVHALYPDADLSQVAELRNHIVASQWITDTAVHKAGTPGLNEDEVRCLSAVINKGTNAERLYKHGWGSRVPMGGYRQTPIGVRSNPLRIFPYHLEVPALMKRFFQWRDDKASRNEMHPLILGIQAMVYFLHIHPFPDGNGRVSRLMMQDAMIRHGYIPVTLPGIIRQDYLRMINDAQDGDPGELVARTLTTQLEAMFTFKTREF